MGDVLQISDAGHVRTLRLNRVEKKNALSQELAWGIIAAVEEAAGDDNVWVQNASPGPVMRSAPAST